jgi:serine protease Do
MPTVAPPSAATVIERVQSKMVKVYGAGGMHGLEAYQSGLLISPDGHVLTAYSHVLDTDILNCVLSDGRKFEAKLIGADPRLEIAVLKIKAGDLPCFDPARETQVEEGEPVLAFSNAYNVAVGNEPASVQHGVISMVTKLEARRGVFETPYRGPVYVLDAKTNNPGSAGGALVDRRGALLAVLGRELKNTQSNIWLNYAVPIGELRASIEAIESGKLVAEREPAGVKKPIKPITLEDMGIVLVPDVLERTPPYVEHVRPGSPAEKAGIRPDDLIVLLGDRLVQSCKLLRSELECLDAADPVKITLLRGAELLEIPLQESP